MSAVYNAIGDVNSMKTCLYYCILFSVYSPADLMPFPGWNTFFIPEASQLKAVLNPACCAVIASGKDMPLPYNNCAYMMPKAR